MRKLGALLLGCALSLSALEAHATPHQTLPASPVEASDSLYLLEGSYTDQTGAKVGLDTFRGQPVLISMFYGSCHGACPLLITNIKKLIGELDPAARERVKVVLVSFDPEHDTTSSLGALFDAHGLDAAKWKFLRTDAPKVQELAAVLGIKYRFAPDGSINHSSVITLLGDKGVIQARVEGDQPNDPILEKLR